MGEKARGIFRGGVGGTRIWGVGDGPGPPLPRPVGLRWRPIIAILSVQRIRCKPLTLPYLRIVESIMSDRPFTYCGGFGTLVTLCKRLHWIVCGRSLIHAASGSSPCRCRCRCRYVARRAPSGYLSDPVNIPCRLPIAGYAMLVLLYHVA